MMKKKLLILAALICTLSTGNAQWGRCEVTGNVAPEVSSRSKIDVGFKLANKNSYDVNVSVWVIYKGEIVSNDEIFVIGANGRLPEKVGETLSMKHWAGERPDFNLDYLSIKINVVKCT